MEKKRIIELITKLNAGDITSQEYKEFSDFIEGDEKYSKIVQMIDAVGVGKSNFNKCESADTENELKRLREKIDQSDNANNNKKQKIGRLPMLMLVAASVLLFIIGGIMIFPRKTNAPANTVLVADRGTKTHVTLPDGTKVWINSDSRITYNMPFGVQNREVTLTGEAYFDVVKDKDHPFIVHTPEMDIKVLGTVFNVRAYAAEKNASATLIKGLVEVTLKGKNQGKRMLRPNEKLVVQNFSRTSDYNVNAQNLAPEIKILTIKKNLEDSSVNETKWVENKLVFEQETLENIIPVLERWYNVRIEMEKSYSDTIKLNGIFNNDKLEDVLNSLKMVARFNYSIQNNKITIY